MRNVTALRAACDPRRHAADGRAAGELSESGYGVDGDVEKIVPLVRQAVELGADVIKADPTDDARRLPPRGRGGQRRAGAGARRRPVTDEEILARTRALMEQGAAGIVYGRNVIQHARPGGDDAGADGRSSTR